MNQGRVLVIGMEGWSKRRYDLVSCTEAMDTALQTPNSQFKNEPAIIVSYEQWLTMMPLEPNFRIAKFIGRSCTVEQTQAALDRVKPEFNHGGEHQLPPVHKSLTWLHSHLIKAGTNPKQLVREADRSVRSLRRQQQYRAIRKWLHLRWLRTPMGRRSLGAAIDIATLHEQTGSTSLRTYRRKFLKHSDSSPS